MTIKEFYYAIVGEERPIFNRIENTDLSRYLESRKWSGEITLEDKSNQGLVDTYLILPGFYVELFSNNPSPIRAVGEESMQIDLRKNLSLLLNKPLSRRK